MHTKHQTDSRCRSRGSPWISILLLLLLSLAPSAHAGEAKLETSSGQKVELLQLSLEELGRLKVTTVSRKSESLAEAAAAVHVITQEDIRRSTATTIAEALRMAPGLDVARANARQWAISSRGFNDLFANKLLVLMDGRTIYTPLFSGVFWEDTDTLLEDIDRIEVIRGPGATLWGANAVNGIINVITKNAQDTQGTLLSGGGGLEERGFGSVRYGGQFATNGYYRVYGKFADRDDFTQIDGRSAEDSWWTAQGGFRLDWQPSDANRLTFQGDYYWSEFGGFIRRNSISPPGMFSDRFHTKSQGGNVLGRWTHEISAASEIVLQTYYDRTDRGFGLASEIRDTFDVDLQHRFNLGERQEIVWGAGYRNSVDQIGETADLKADGSSVSRQLFSAFAQDELALIHERLHLTAGTKVEHNDFTGFEVQPSIRIAWTPNKRHTLWAAVSRAVRTPSRAERGFQFFSDPPPSVPRLPLPTVIPAAGNPDFRSEELIAYELGYRVKPHPKLSLDCAFFYNEYDHLYNVAQLPIEVHFSPAFEPYLLVPVTDNNALFGETYGAEFTATWQVLESLRLRSSYTFLQMNLHTRGPMASFTEESERDSPRHQISLWSDADLGRHIECGIGVRFVDSLPSQEISAYTELDFRLAWKPNPHVEYSIVGRNLLDAHHQEFSPFLFSNRNVEVDRAVFAKATFRF